MGVRIFQGSVFAPRILEEFPCRAIQVADKIMFRPSQAKLWCGRVSAPPETLVSNYVPNVRPPRNFGVQLCPRVRPKLLTLPSGVHQWFQVLFAPHLPLVIVITLDESFPWITGVGIILLGTTPMGAIRVSPGGETMVSEVVPGGETLVSGVVPGGETLVRRVKKVSAKHYFVRHLYVMS